MIGSIVGIYPTITNSKWRIVAWDMLGYADYKEIIEPWCVENLEAPVRFEASACVVCESMEDATLLALRFK